MTFRLVFAYHCSNENGNYPCCPDAPRIPELGYHICEKRRGITSRVVERLIAKRTELKKLQKQLWHNFAKTVCKSLKNSGRAM